MNQHVEQEPARRPDLYAENEHDYSQIAAEADISLLSTWDLFLILRAVEDDQMTAADARRRIETPGLVKGPSLA